MSAFNEDIASFDIVGNHSESSELSQDHYEIEDMKQELDGLRLMNAQKTDKLEWCRMELKKSCQLNEVTLSLILTISSNVIST